MPTRQSRPLRCKCSCNALHPRRFKRQSSPRRAAAVLDAYGAASGMRRRRLAPQGRQHTEILREQGVASAVPKAFFDPQLAIQLRPGQCFLHLKQLAADPVLDQLGLRSSAPCLFQATFDLPTGARFSISDTSRVADGELKNVCQSRIAMVQTIIDGPPRQGPQKHHPACGMPRHSVNLSSRHCVYLK